MPAAGESTKRRLEACRDLVMHPGERFLRFLDNRRQTFLFVSLFLILIGARAVVINYAGNTTPYTDEWDGEAASLLEPYLKGALTIGDLFHAHNEHVIFFTRLLTLAIFNVSGYWDVVLQMIANAILDAATVVAISYALSRPLRGGWALAAMILSALVNAFPLSYDNILLGFNTHFYLLLAFSFASLWFMADSRAWSPRWAAGVAVRARLVPLHGLGRADARRCDRSASHADGMRSQRGHAGMAGDRRPRRRDHRPGEPHSSRAIVGRLQGAFVEAVPVGCFRVGELARPSQFGRAHGVAVGAVQPAHICRSSGAERCALVQCRGVRLDPDAIRGVCGRTRVDPGREPLPGYFVDRPGRQYDKLLLARGIGCGRRQAQDLVVCGPSGMAGHRRGVVGPSRTPAARLDGPAAQNRRRPREKFALLSRHRRCVVSRRRSR